MKVNIINPVILPTLMILAILTSCSSRFDDWKSLGFKTNKKIKKVSTLDDFKNQFGAPDSLNLLNFSIDELKYADVSFLYVDPYNPSISDEIGPHEKEFVELVKNNMFPNLRGSISDRREKPKNTILEDFDYLTFPGTHEADHSENDWNLDFSYKELANNTFSKEVTCKSCKRLVSLRNILGDYVYFTTKKEWVKSIISKYPNDYRAILSMEAMFQFTSTRKLELRGQGNKGNRVDYYDLPKEGTRYVFPLDKNNAHPFNDGIQKVNSYGYIDVVLNSDQKIKGHYFEVTEESRSQVQELIMNSDWIYGDVNSPRGAIKFNSDQTFSYSTSMFGGFSKRGTWEIDDEGDVYTFTDWSSNGEKIGSKEWFSLTSENALNLKGGETTYTRL